MARFEGRALVSSKDDSPRLPGAVGPDPLAERGVPGPFLTCPEAAPESQSPTREVSGPINRPMKIRGLRLSLIRGLSIVLPSGSAVRAMSKCCLARAETAGVIRSRWGRCNGVRPKAGNPAAWKVGDGGERLDQGEGRYPRQGDSVALNWERTASP